MFNGNLYFALPLARAAQLFTDFDFAKESGFFSSPFGPDERLFCFSDDKTAMECGKHFFAEQAVAVPGSHDGKPVLALVHIGPIAPMALSPAVQSDVQLNTALTATVISKEGLARIAQIVSNGAFAWNRVDMTMKLFTV